MDLVLYLMMGVLAFKVYVYIWSDDEDVAFIKKMSRLNRILFRFSIILLWPLWVVVLTALAAFLFIGIFLKTLFE